jgi:hypothetical protein
MKVSDLVRYDPERECFVLRDNSPPLSPFRWKEDPRPSIFLKDVYFRTKGSGTIANETGLGYKQFGTYTKARQPNKHEGVLPNAKTKTPRAVGGTTGKNV